LKETRINREYNEALDGDLKYSDYLIVKRASAIGKNGYDCYT